ncbi:MAG: arsenate reductase family protein [Paracoccaceae bacterium]
MDLTDEAAILAAMADDPRLIERPVLISETTAAIGRPPENILTLL